MTMAISKAVEEGAKAVICASTGNTSASAAAYAARAGIDCVVLIPEKAIALGKLAQALIHGAKVVAVRGQLRPGPASWCARSREKYPIVLVNSLNPYRIEGQKTGCLRDLRRPGRGARLPFHPGGQRRQHHRLLEGLPANTSRPGRIERPAADDRLPGGGRRAHRAGPRRREPRDHRHGHPHRQPRQLEEGGGGGGGVAGPHRHGHGRGDPGRVHLLARREGVFCEPASAASVAGLYKASSAGQLPRAARRWCASSPATA